MQILFYDKAIQENILILRLTWSSPSNWTFSKIEQVESFNSFQHLFEESWFFSIQKCYFGIFIFV